MDVKIDKLVEWKKNSGTGPFRLEIHPTNRCNLKCKMCGTRAVWEEEDKDMSEIIEHNRESEMSDEKLVNLIEQAANHDVERILLTGGGEPFIRKDLVLDMMKKIKEKEIFGNLNTNGTLLKKKDLERIVKMKWDLIMFSIDSPYAAVHDYIRGKKGAYHQAVKSILYINEFKEKYNIDLPEIAFNTVLTDENYEQIPELVLLASKLNCNDLTLFPLINEEKHEELKIKDTDHLICKLDKAMDLANRKGLHNNFEDVKDQIETDENVRSDSSADSEHNVEDSDDNGSFVDVSCFEPFLNMVIKMDGSVTPCCMIDEVSDNIKGKSFEDVWYGDYFTELRSDFRNDIIPEGCSECMLSKEVRNEDIRSSLNDELKL